MSAPAPVTSDDAATSGKAWRRITMAWMLAYCFSLAASALVIAADHRAWYLYGILTVMAAGFAVIARPALNDPGDPRIYLLHLAIAGIGATVVIIADPSVSFLVTVVLSQFAPVFGFRLRGIALLALLAMAMSLPIGFRDHWSTSGTWGWGVTAGTAVLVNVFIGSFTGELISDNQRRGALIRELEATRAELDRANHEAGARAERERMQREIHDTLAQGFTSILMLVQAAEATLDTDRETTRERLSLAAQTARENLAEARSLVGDVGPADLAQMPLETALRRVVERTGRELRIRAEVVVSGDSRPLPANLQVVLLRVAQEALANVRKHAQAAGVTVRLGYQSADVRLEITDDGVGFDPAACPGFGLGSMRSRVEQAEGTLRLSSAPGSGTTVEVRVPWTS